MPIRLAVLAAAVAIGIPTPGLAAAPKGDPLTAALRTAIDRGELLYIYDQAAWHGTDDIRAKFPNLLAQAGGYVVTGDQTRTELVFYDKLKIRAVYRATFAGGKLGSSGPATGPRAGLTPLERQMIVAKEKGYDAFLAADVGLCSRETPNLAALPPEKQGGPSIVYLMTPQSDLNIYPLGGHFSVEIEPDGSAGKVRPYMKTCFDMSMKGTEANVRPGERPVGFYVTHLLDPTPTEIHVFTSIASKTPIFVATGPETRVWIVNGNRISLRPDAGKPK